MAKAQAISHRLIDLSRHHAVLSYPCSLSICNLHFSKFSRQRRPALRIAFDFARSISRHTLCELGGQSKGTDHHAGKADHRIIRHYIFGWDSSIAVVNQDGNRREPFSLYDGGIWLRVCESLDTRPCAELHRRGRRTRTVHLDSDLCALEAARKNSVKHPNFVRQSL